MAVQQKLQRIRGPRGMPRAWVLPENEVIASAADPWVRRLRNAAAGAFAVALVLYGLYRLLLGGQAGRIRDGVAQLIGG